MAADQSERSTDREALANLAALREKEREILQLKRELESRTLLTDAEVVAKVKAMFCRCDCHLTIECRPHTAPFTICGLCGHRITEP